MPRRGYTRRWRTLRITQPAVQTDWEIRAPGSAWLRVISVTARLVTDANVADRGVIFRADDQSATWWLQPSSSLVTANSTVDFALSTGGEHNTITQGVITEPLPSAGLLLAPGHRLRPVTSNLQAGDQWSAIVARVDESPSDDPFIGDYSIILPEDVRGQSNGDSAV